MNLLQKFTSYVNASERLTLEEAEMLKEIVDKLSKNQYPLLDNIFIPVNLKLDTSMIDTTAIQTDLLLLLKVKIDAIMKFQTEEVQKILKNLFFYKKNSKNSTEEYVGKTGQNAKYSGVYSLIDGNESIPLAIGDNFPPYKGKAAVWKLKQLV